MKYRNILVTGGAGFIGSSLSISFKKKYPKSAVIALDNLKRHGSHMNLRRLKKNGVSFIHGDIRCPEDLNLRQEVDLLIECSAEPSVLAGFGDNPLYVVNTNLFGTVNCLELARRKKADVVFLSTSRVYPYEAINNIRTKESKTRFDWISTQKITGWSIRGIDSGFTTCGSKTLYGSTKLSSELILQEYIANYGLKGTINRCGVVAGPWQFGKVDQGVFTFWMLAHYFRKNIKYIGFGAKGKQVRDLLHIEDLFRLIDIQVNKLDKINGNIYNIGGGRKSNLSLLETTKLCQDITGNKLDIKGDSSARPGDIKIYITDNLKAERELNWHPHIGPEQILADIFYWIRDNEFEIRESL